MSMLDSIANEMILTNLTQMTLRVSAGLLGLQNLRVAVLGESNLPSFAYEVLLSDSAPSYTLDRYDRVASMYVKSYSQFDPNKYDCIIAMGKTTADENEIRALLSGVVFGTTYGKLLLEWNRFPSAVLSVLGRLEPLPTCLNYQKLFALAAAVYLTENSTSIIECGVFKGGSTVYIGLLLEALAKNNQVYALDTFCGIPAPIAQDLSGDSHYPEGFFSETSLGTVTNLYRSFGLQHRLFPIAGLVGDTLPPLLASLDQPCGFALIDVDQYRGIYDAVHGLLKRYGRIFTLIDDTSLAGVDQALRDSCSGIPVHRTRIGFNLDVLSFSAPRPLGAQLQSSADGRSLSQVSSTSDVIMPRILDRLN